MTLSLTDESESLNSLIWDKPYYSYRRKPFIPCIYDISPASDLSGIQQFNTVLLSLDGKLKSELDWKILEEKASEWIEKGYAIFWDLDLGLFGGLTHSLTYQTQYLSLCLSVDHFRDTLWKKFKEYTVGLNVYRGPIDFSRQFNWDEEQIKNLHGWLKDRFETVQFFQEEMGIDVSEFNQIELSHLFQSESGHQLIRLFCRDVCMEYLAFLTNRLPDRLAVYTLVDITGVINPLWQAQLLHPERFERFVIGVKGAKIPYQGLGWQAVSPYGVLAQENLPAIPQKQSPIGVCLPGLDYCRPFHYQGIENALSQLIDQKIGFRLISETHLITEWDGLDYLLVVPSGLGNQGKRKLQGFCAAGGTVVTLGAKIGLSQEISFSDFMCTYR